MSINIHYMDNIHYLPASLEDLPLITQDLYHWSYHRRPWISIAGKPPRRSSKESAGSAALRAGAWTPPSPAGWPQVVSDKIRPWGSYYRDILVSYYIYIYIHNNIYIYTRNIIIYIYSNITYCITYIYILW